MSINTDRNMPVVNNDFTVVELGSTSSNGDKLIPAIMVKMNSALTIVPTGDIKGLLISNDHASHKCYINSEDMASSATRGLVLDTGDAIYFAIRDGCRDGNAITYSTSGTVSVAVYY